jgi:hypothetical protein
LGVDRGHCRDRASPASADSTRRRESPSIRCHEAIRRRHGIPYSSVEVAALREEAAKAGVAPLAVSRQRLGGG